MSNIRSSFALILKKYCNSSSDLEFVILLPRQFASIPRHFVNLFSEVFLAVPFFFAGKTQEYAVSTKRTAESLVFENDDFLKQNHFSDLATTRTKMISPV